MSHPLELAIVGPGNARYYLQSDNSVPSTLSADEFAQLTELRLDVDSALGIQWVDGEPRKRRIFDTAGEYTIILAENLETEPENTLYLTDRVTYEDA